MTFVSVLETVGKDFEKGLEWAVKYAVPVEKLVGLLFPAAGPVVNEVVDATTLIQNAVLLVEQKYAAAGAQNGTGTEKLAEVTLLAGKTVSALLAKAGVNADQGYIENIISAVVAILNVQSGAEAGAAQKA